VVVALGANLPWQGQPATQTLVDAVSRLQRSGHFQDLKVSSFWRSSPVQAQGPDFVNGVLVARSEATPEQLLALLLETERAFGRDRSASPLTTETLLRLSPARTLDLDLIAVGELHRQTADLRLPHPRATERAFVLEPLAQLAPSLVLQHPSGESARVADWLARLPSDVRAQLHPVE
jgi:2-amino-4-hydroxy-6-hydroxymethyldihydropteridine diphosphokinase